MLVIIQGISTNGSYTRANSANLSLHEHAMKHYSEEGRELVTATCHASADPSDEAVDDPLTPEIEGQDFVVETRLYFRPATNAGAAPTEFWQKNGETGEVFLNGVPFTS